MTASPRTDPTLPSLFVLGAMKCGTSSLHYYLDVHPQIAMSNPKETNFFLDSEPVVPDGTDTTTAGLLREQSRADRGLEWYRSRFDPDAEVRGESSVAYGFPWYPRVAAAIAELIPAPRFIFCVRHPLERMVSHYLQFAARDGRAIDEALAAPGNPYVAASRYRSALDPFLTRFGSDRVLLVRQRDLLGDRAAAMARVFDFAGVDPEFRSSAFGVERNASRGKGRGYRLAERARAGRAARLAALAPPRLRVGIERLLRRSTDASERPRPSPELSRRLLSELEPEITGVEELSGWELSDWRVPREH